MTIIEAINDEHLFKPLFRDPMTWSAWRVFLKSLFALPMDDDELELYRRCTGRQTPPDKPFREAWVPTGVRSGKSFIAALVAVFLACFKNYQPFLAPGERAMILVIAADRSQARVIFRYVKAFLGSNRMMKKMIQAERTESIDLSNGVSIEVATCSYKSVRGFTAAAVICDEVAFWRSDDGSNPSSEVLRALRPRLATIPDSLLLAISSPYMRSGPLWDAFKNHHGKDDSDVLCWKATSREMNPCISQELIDRDMAADPVAAASEWLAEFRSDLESFIDLVALQAVIVQGRHELPPRLHTRPPFKYTAFCDPSGGRHDAATLAIAHREGERIVLDLAHRWPAPHDPAQVVSEMAAVLKTYDLHQVTGDRYAGAWPEQEFLKSNIRYEPSDRDKSKLYLDFGPLINSGQVELLDLKHLKSELVALERRTRSGGRDSVDHPPKGSDDLANSVAGVCSLMGGPARQAWVMDRRVAPREDREPSQRAILRNRARLLQAATRQADPGPALGPGFAVPGPWFPGSGGGE